MDSAAMRVRAKHNVDMPTHEEEEKYFGSLPNGKAYRALYNNQDRVKERYKKAFEALSPSIQLFIKISEQKKVVEKEIAECKRLKAFDSEAAKVKMTKIVREDSNKLMEICNEYKRVNANNPDVKPILAEGEAMELEFKQLPLPINEGEQRLYDSFQIINDILSKKREQLKQVGQTFPEGIADIIQEVCNMRVGELVMFINLPNKTTDKSVAEVKSPAKSGTATAIAAFAHEGAGARAEHKSGNDSSDSEDELQPGSARVHPAPSSFHTARTAPSSREGSPTQTPAGNVTPPRMQLHGAGEMKEPSAPVQEQPRWGIRHIPEEEMRQIRARNAAYEKAEREKAEKERQVAEAKMKKEAEVAAAIAAMEADEKRSKKGKCAIM